MDSLILSMNRLNAGLFTPGASVGIGIKLSSDNNL